MFMIEIKLEHKRNMNLKFLWLSDIKTKDNKPTSVEG